MGEQKHVPLTGWRVLSIGVEAHDGEMIEIPSEKWGGPWRSTELTCVCGSAFALHYPACIEAAPCPYCGLPVDIAPTPDDPEPWATSDNDEDNYPGGWYASLVVCVLCDYRWAAVYPDCCTEVECGQCGHMNRAPHLLDDERDEDDDETDEGEAWRETSDPSEAGDEP